MANIKTAKRSLYSEQLEQLGFEFTCKVNMDSKTGEIFMEIPNHFADTFIIYDINMNEEFTNHFNFSIRKEKAVVYFIDKDISTFDRKIAALNQFYYELKSEECVKKVIVVDSKLAHNFFHTNHENYLGTSNTNTKVIEDINDFSFVETGPTTSSIINFGYRVGYQIGIYVYSRPDWEGVQPSPLLCDLSSHESKEIKVIDWTQEREDFLQMIYCGMERLILQLDQFKNSITDQALLEKIDNKQIGNLNSLMIENK